MLDGGGGWVSWFAARSDMLGWQSHKGAFVSEARRLYPETPTPPGTFASWVWRMVFWCATRSVDARSGK